MIDPTPAFFDTLMRTQFLQPDRMQVYQRGLLERLVRHARSQVPFYRDQGRLDPLFTPNGEIDWRRWTDIPVLTRAEAQRNEQALYAENVPPECGEVISGYTAGSTGTPLAYRVNFRSPPQAAPFRNAPSHGQACLLGGRWRTCGTTEKANAPIRQA